MFYSNEKLFIPKLLLNGEKELEQDTKFNSRAKFIPTPNGGLKLVEEMYCNRYIFNPNNVEIYNKEYDEQQAKWRSDLEEMYGYNKRIELTTLEVNKTKETNIQRSKRRAKKQIIDYILCNNFTNFCTLTLDKNKIDRGDYNSIMKRLNRYLDNRVRRLGLKYVGVPELHKNGGFHFHFLTNDVLPLVESGTYIRPCGGRPVKKSTLQKQGIDVKDCKTVYNISDWQLGFTTSIYTYGEPMQIANYIGKYITKGDKKIGGRWYYSGGKLEKPVYKYFNTSFGHCVGDYGFICDGGAFIIKQYK